MRPGIIRFQLRYLLECAHCLIVLTCRIELSAKFGRGIGVQGIERDCLSHLCEAFLSSAHYLQVFTKPKAGHGVIWVEFQGPPVFLFGALPVPVVELDNVRERRMRLTERFVNCHSLAGCPFRLGKDLLWGQASGPTLAQGDITLGEARISRSIVRTLLNCALEVRDAFPRIAFTLPPQ